MGYLDSNFSLRWNAKLAVENFDEHQALRYANDSGVKENLIGFPTVLEETLKKVKISVRSGGPVIKRCAASLRHGYFGFDSIFIWSWSEFLTIFQRDTNRPAECSYLGLSDSVE